MGRPADYLPSWTVGQWLPAPCNGGTCTRAATLEPTRRQRGLTQNSRAGDPKRKRPNCHKKENSRNSVGSAQKGGGPRTPLRKKWMASRRRWLLLGCAGIRAEAVGVATVLNSFPSHLTVCTSRGIGLTKYGQRTFSELSFPGLVPRPSWRPRISACYRVHDWRRYAARLPFLLQFDFGSSFLEGPARQVLSRPDAGRNFIHSSRCGKA